MKKQQLATTYISVVAGLGVLCFLANALDIRATAALDPVMFLLILVLAGFAQRNPVKLAQSSTISVAFAVKIAAYVLFGTGVALWATVVTATVNAYTPTRKPLRKVLFNFGQFTIATYLASSTYQLVGGLIPPGPIVPTLLAVALSAVVYFAVSSTLTAGVVALTSQVTFVEVWRQNFAWMPINYLATAVNGAALALAYQSLGVVGVLVFVLPLTIAWYSFKLYVMRSSQLQERNRELTSLNNTLERTTSRLEESHVSVIAALLGSLAAKDRYTQGHSAATMHHALAVAKSLGLGPDEIAAVNLGALFHDIGKIGIPEHILRKPSQLTEDEWAEMKTHPVIGANLLGEVPNLERIRPIVLAHHERYDGTGYPSGLKGDQIPLAAQIISVADTYEAMTSTRSYRGALTHEMALVELRRVSGTQLNPLVVDAFIRQIESAPPVNGEHAHDAAADHIHVRERALEAVRLTT